MKGLRKAWRRLGKFEKTALLVLIGSICIYFGGLVLIKSQESELNIKSQELEYRIATSQTNINALTLSIENKTKLQYLKDVATARGLSYNNNSEITAYVKTAE